MGRRNLYPEIQPYEVGRLRVSKLHELHYEVAGNPAGKPVLFVHGGPGGGSKANDRRFFDPEKFRIVLFDQRGAGRSTPHASTEENTTWHLIDDMEKLRRHLKIETWMLFGGSWGSTLSLAYAEAHPDHVDAMVLRGIFLLQRSEFDWYYRDGTPAVFPEAAARFHALVPHAESDDIVGAYHALATGEDDSLRRKALCAWARWEGETSSLYPDPQRIEKYADPEFAAAFAGIELHYFHNGGFFHDENQLLREARRIRDIPGVIVHGRYDMVCPVRNAFALHRRWPASKLEIVPDAGHDAGEPGTVDALVRATDRFGE